MLKPGIFCYSDASGFLTKGQLWKKKKNQCASCKLPYFKIMRSITLILISGYHLIRRKYTQYSLKVQSEMQQKDIFTRPIIWRLDSVFCNFPFLYYTTLFRPFFFLLNILIFPPLGEIGTQRRDGSNQSVSAQAPVQLRLNWDGALGLPRHSLLGNNSALFCQMSCEPLQLLWPQPPCAPPLRRRKSALTYISLSPWNRRLRLSKKKKNQKSIRFRHSIGGVPVVVVVVGGPAAGLAALVMWAY